MNKNNTSPQELLHARRRSIAQSIYDHYPFKVEMIARGDWHYGYATINTLSLAISPCQLPNAPWTMKIRFEEKGCRPVYLMILKEGSFKSIYPDLLEDSPIFHNAIAACAANGSDYVTSRRC